ncbi:hypothetical protein L9F63_009046 [Diploptera punctata]|uniref:HAT C-terminal dimerisation domain-containing protein n=1 Tax=Diploptera punctata TaxID=6984 RepID=A0AAD7Z422_DIPPU|nr:hypothetical protein L9F63_009046 [Diploptera punctata]
MCQGFDSKYWAENPGKHITFGEAEIRKLARKFRLNEREAVCGFCEYLQENTFPDILLPLKHTLGTIAISSSECEKGFSQMNLIVTLTRSSILVRTTSALLFIRIVGPSLTQFKPSKYGCSKDVILQLIPKARSDLETTSVHRRTC